MENLKRAREGREEFAKKDREHEKDNVLHYRVYRGVEMAEAYETYLLEVAGVMGEMVKHVCAVAYGSDTPCENCARPGTCKERNLIKRAQSIIDQIGGVE